MDTALFLLIISDGPMPLNLLIIPYANQFSAEYSGAMSAGLRNPLALLFLLITLWPVIGFKAAVSRSASSRPSHLNCGAH